MDSATPNDRGSISNSSDQIQGGTTASSVIPEGFDELVGPPPLIEGEDSAEFESLLTIMIVDIDPNGFVEFMLVYHVVVLIWEIRRHRRFKVHILQNARVQALHHLLTLVEENKARECLAEEAEAKAYFLGDKKTVARVDKLLGQSGYSIHSVMAQAQQETLLECESLERMAANAEARLYRLLREQEARQERLAARLSRAADKKITDI